MQQFIFIFSVISLGFIVGQVLAKYRENKLDKIRHICIYIALRITIPLSILLAVWQLKITSLNVLQLPVIGASTIMLGFVAGRVMGSVMQMPPSQLAVYAPAGGFTNIGAIGALSVLVFIGESGLALLPLYKLFEEVIYYSFLFRFAARRSSLKVTISRYWWNDPITIIALTAVTTGLLLNFAGLQRPELFETINHLLVPIGTFTLMVSVGISFSLKSLNNHWKQGLKLSLIKQLILPTFITSCVLILGLFTTIDTNMVKVVFLLASMPMAFIVIVPAALYKLDIDLANSCWFMSTVLFLLMLPLFPWALSLL